MRSCWLIYLLYWVGVGPPSQLQGAKLNRPEPLSEDVSVHEAENTIINSFNKLLDVAQDSTDLSSFSDELAFAVLSVLQNLSASCESTVHLRSQEQSSMQNFAVVRRRVAAEVDSASRNEFLDNPDADRCFSRIYARLCITRDVTVRHTLQSQGPAAMCARKTTGIFAHTVESAHLSDAFSKSISLTLMNLQRRYVDGQTCEAPPTYEGTCDTILRIGTLSNEEKARIAARCNLEWPLNFRARYDFSAPCPLGWTVLQTFFRMIRQFPECQAPYGYSGPCTKPQSFASMDATWPVKDAAERNYGAPCPSLWRLETKQAKICTAPASYNGPCQTRLDFTKYDAEMKRALEGRCKPLISVVSVGQEAGPIGPAHTKFHGTVVAPNGTIYLPSKTTRSYSPASSGPPKAPDNLASLAAATASHIKRLQNVREAAVDPKLTSLITVCCDLLAFM
ncbi:hypothetical protein Esti_002194 [Eimeria stiedai]